MQLNKKEILRLDKAKTNRQYLRELRESCPGIYSDFEKFSDAFALHWYGSRPTTSDILETWFSKYDTILERSAFSYDEK